MPPGIQLIACAFALAMAYLTYLDFRRRRFHTWALAFWLAVWAGVAAISLFPGIFGELSRSLRLARPMDLAVVLGILVLTAVTYHNFSTLHNLDRQLERLVREQALSQLDTTKPTAPKSQPTD